MTATVSTIPAVPAVPIRRTDKLLALLRRRPVSHAAQPSINHSPGGGPDSGPDVWLAGLRLGS
ncbi:hypothetical protein [Streptomyces umbrinus]|uniref:hypothetical protein n=1 Tax=Streptomyces umbrinus TaxID=67370 RepID=UPI00167596C0|nr:hypothetical protein [Streptomyces umbrinus]MCR3723781.1 hypothetical protein [Streptomyces umbrinus]GHH42619.1 hypothetical protein GCM10018775_27770 [Streptomyces umbrinus]